MNNRISYIDGHRGIAILLVVLFHAYARWPEVVPYGGSFSNIIIFKYGWLGVQLFFLISGYVILMTLENCKGIKEFLFRRWIRLFPAMLISSFVIFSTAPYFFERPAGQPSLLSLLPGLSFIETSWWNFILNVPIIPLEGAFWSIYVEIKFYFFAALVYFSLGQKWLIALLFLLNLFAVLYKLGNGYLPIEISDLLKSIVDNLSFEYFGWFAAGSAFYLYKKYQSMKWFFISIFSSIFSSMFVENFHWRPTLAALTISLFFAISLNNIYLQSILNNRFFRFFGFISYPLYLIHENIMVSMIVKSGKINLFFPMFLYPILPILILSIITYFIAKYFEPYSKKILLIFVSRLLIMFRRHTVSSL